MAIQSILAGTGFEGRAFAIRAYCRPGMPVRLVREPSNPHDPNAVSVHISTRLLLIIPINRQIGYLKASMAARSAPKIDAGRLRRAWIESMWAPEGRDHPRVTISIEFADR